MYLQNKINKLLESGFKLHDYEGNQINRNTVTQTYEKIRNYILNNTEQNDSVGIILEADYKYLLCIFACMELGRIYVPLRSSWPTNRIDQIKQIVTIRLLIDESTLNEIKNYKKESQNDKSPLVSQNDILYIIFTSGSTGEPKGVEITRYSYEHFVKWVDENIEITNNNKMLFVADFTFDMSLLDVALLICSQCEAYFSKFTDNIFRLAHEIVEYKITSIATVPNTIDRLFDKNVLARTDISSLKYLLLGGARFSFPTLKKIIGVNAQKIEVYNFYGPTEATVYTNVHKLTFDESSDLFDSNVTIGKPFSGMKCLLIDSNGEEITETHMSGELLLGGPQVMKGYASNKTKTENVLINYKGISYYKTGDLAFFDDRGYYYVVGRLDDTIKRRGYRINLLDIEAYIRKVDGILDCKIINLPDELFENKIIAFIILSDDANQYLRDEKKLKSELSKILVDYQIPDKFIFSESFPLNNSGKISKKELTVIAREFEK